MLAAISSSLPCAHAISESAHSSTEFQQPPSSLPRAPVQARAPPGSPCPCSRCGPLPAYATAPAAPATSIPEPSLPRLAQSSIRRPARKLVPCLLRRRRREGFRPRPYPRHQPRPSARPPGASGITARRCTPRGHGRRWGRWTAGSQRTARSCCRRYRRRRCRPSRAPRTIPAASPRYIRWPRRRRYAERPTAPCLAHDPHTNASSLGLRETDHIGKVDNDSEGVRAGGLP
mmetsp:Transcript_15877/g.40621  ORF Transcript_15877/g.40621 Transcript_15877/m.40621 type:complete len:231 (+) Transcript_15877:165-857(+)